MSQIEIVKEGSALLLEELFNSIPQEVRDMYEMKIYKNGISISNPAFIHIDNVTEVYSNGVTWNIVSDKANLTLWIRTKIVHLTIF